MALLSLEHLFVSGFPCLPSYQWNTYSNVSVLVWTNSFSMSLFSIQSGLRISSLLAANFDGTGSESELKLGATAGLSESASLMAYEVARRAARIKYFI